jgi:molybdenum cofactor synthesis domain-containing protein
VAADRNRSAFVLTISDRVSAGRAVDESGPALTSRLEQEGFVVERGLVSDDREQISSHVETAAQDHALVIATGGTGLAPRDVTPQALRDILDYDVPGFGEAMRAEGRRSTPFASLSRSLAGVVDRALVIALPGSTRGALESLEAVIPLLDHALETLAGERAAHARESAAPAPESRDQGPSAS